MAAKAAKATLALRFSAAMTVGVGVGGPRSTRGVGRSVDAVGGACGVIVAKQKKRRSS